MRASGLAHAARAYLLHELRQHLAHRCRGPFDSQDQWQDGEPHVRPALHGSAACAYRKEQGTELVKVAVRRFLPVLSIAGLLNWGCQLQTSAEPLVPTELDIMPVEHLPEYVIGFPMHVAITVRAHPDVSFNTL